MDLPLPVGPTTPTNAPGGIDSVTSRSTGASALYANATRSNAIAPFRGSGSRASGRSWTVMSTSRMSAMRSSAT